MIQANNVTVQFGGRALFERVNVTFSKGNCYGIIGANGAGKTTFLRILSGDLEPTTGEVIIPKEERMSILKQDHFQYDAYTVLDTVMMGNQRLYDVMKEKDALYEKEDFTDEDGVKASELEAEFAEMGGWEAESDVSRLIQGLGLSNDILYSEMSSLTAKEKVCLHPDPEGHPACLPELCPYANGYYDRIKDALSALLDLSLIHI